MTTLDVSSDRATGTAAGPSEQPFPGDTGPGSIGVVVGRDESERAQLEALLAAARNLRPQLRAEQAATEERGFYSPDMHQAFLDAGYFRVLLPKQWGGLELGAEAFFQVVTEVARGCPSTAWCLALSAGQTLIMASYWPEQAQQEVFGEHGYLVAPASSGVQKDVVITREVVDGVPGLRISGTWKYCSGSPHSTHFMPRFVLPPDEDSPDTSAGNADFGDDPMLRWAVVPRSSYTVLDDWGGIIGMKGSGSNGIHIDDAFVPDHHIVETPWMFSTSGDTVGSRLHGNPIYGGPALGFLEGEIGAIAAGMGLAALDEFERIITTSRDPFSTGTLMSENQMWLSKLGIAFALVDSAVAVSARGGQLFEEHARRSVAGLEPFSAEKSMRLNNMYYAAEEQVSQAIEMMLRSVGSRHSAEGARLLRYFRDMHTIRTRSVDQLDLSGADAAQAHLAAKGK
jgi:3-hydroxy-9,10-secoandrosta-1,3,5(10)-triene-9,17-dione monooxygenase